MSGVNAQGGNRLDDPTFAPSMSPNGIQSTTTPSVGQTSNAPTTIPTITPTGTTTTYNPSLSPTVAGTTTGPTEFAVVNEEGERTSDPSPFPTGAVTTSPSASVSPTGATTTAVTVNSTSELTNITSSNSTVTDIVVPIDAASALGGIVAGGVATVATNGALFDVAMNTAGVALTSMTSLGTASAVVTGGAIVGGAGLGYVLAREGAELAGLASESEKEEERRRLETEIKTETGADQKNKWPTQERVGYLGAAAGAGFMAAAAVHHHGWKPKSDTVSLAPFLTLALRDNLGLELCNELSHMNESAEKSDELKRLNSALKSALLKLAKHHNNGKPITQDNENRIANAVGRGRIELVQDLIFTVDDIAADAPNINKKIESALGFYANTIRLPVASPEYALLKKARTRIVSNSLEQEDIELGNIQPFNVGVSQSIPRTRSQNAMAEMQKVQTQEGEKEEGEHRTQRSHSITLATKLKRETSEFVSAPALATPAKTAASDLVVNTDTMSPDAAASTGVRNRFHPELNVHTPGINTQLRREINEVVGGNKNVGNFSPRGLRVIPRFGSEADSSGLRSGFREDREELAPDSKIVDNSEIKRGRKIAHTTLSNSNSNDQHDVQQTPDLLPKLADAAYKTGFKSVDLNDPEHKKKSSGTTVSSSNEGSSSQDSSPPLGRGGASRTESSSEGSPNIGEAVDEAFANKPRPRVSSPDAEKVNRKGKELGDRATL